MKSSAIAALAIALAFLFITDTVGYIRILLQPTHDDSLCPLFDPRAPPSFHKDNSTVLKILKDETYRQISADRLSKAVQVDTLVRDHMPLVSESPESWAQFAKFHKYLEETYPLIHKHVEVHKVNTYGLVYYWKGSQESLKPLLLAAHQDVVPVQKDTWNDWTYPPFSGHFDGETIFGRGASDCKNLLMAAMDSVELLLENGYKPTRGVIIALGFDEEVSGWQGANYIAQFLEEKFGKKSIYAIIDEGPGLIRDVISGNWVAAPATSEKGYLDIEVELFMKGGHSSMPPEHGAIAIMGELARNMEMDPFEPALPQENPILRYAQCIATHSTGMGKLQKKTIFRAGFDKVANSQVIKALSKIPLTRYLIRTSQAIDVIHGGEKANALPEKVSMITNHRVAIGTSTKVVEDRFVSRIVDIAKAYGLKVEAYGKTIYEPRDSVGNFLVSDFVIRLESAPVSPSTGKVWEYLASTTRHVFENLVFENKMGYPLVTAPSIMPANTDTRHYWDLTDNIFRYTPMTADMTKNNIHSVDEHMNLDAHLQLTAWYFEYIQNVDTADAE